MRKFPFLLTKVQTSWSYVRQRHYADSANKNMYITTPIFYVNAGPHIGHLYTAVLADAIARFNSMLGHSVILCTGTDEHGTKVQKAATTAEMPIIEYCTQISRQFQGMCDTFQVDYSQFIRTTENRHQEAVRHFWATLQERGHIYLGKYSGWYCVSDEAFLSDMELMEKTDASGKTIKVSVESGSPVEWTEESSYKFRLSSFQDDLRHWLKDENTVRPAMYHKALSNWIEDGACLQDLSISRPVSRVPWAIHTPGDESQSIYVWLDALVNYLTSVGYPNDSFRQFWPPNVQVIGKDILKFHGIYWPAFLIAAGLEPPRRLQCHAHWTVNDQKMSKSKGNVISPFEAMNDFTPDGLRYFLLRQAVPHSDANYNVVKLQRILNAELADSLGNLISRCLGKAINPLGEIPDPAEYIDTVQSPVYVKLTRELEVLGKTAEKFYEECNLHHVVDAVISVIHNSNQMIEHHKPWNLKKSDDPDSIKEMKAVISLGLESARVAALILYPIVPGLASNLLDSLQIPNEERAWNNTAPLYLKNSSNGVRRIQQQNSVFFKKIRN